MELVSKAEDLSALIQGVKSRGGSLITNLFADPDKLSYWIDKKMMFFKQTEAGVLLFRRSSSFYHLYYHTTSLNDLQSLLNHSLPTERLVIDILGKSQSLDNLLRILKEAGFNIHKQLDRYVRINTGQSQYYEEVEAVTLAETNDAANIAHLLKENFDKLSEQVPDLSEVDEMVKEKKVLVIKNKGVINGFLIRTFIGQSTILNNFLVDKQYRGEKVGSKLLKHYIFESRSFKRMILWVVSDNKLAISAYKGHGYTKEDLVDYILINH